MAEVLFYHLTARPLEQALPALLEKSLARGWRVALRVGSAARLEALNLHLWTYRDESFLPHGAAEDGGAARQPIWLTTGDDNPNGAQIQFLVDGAEPAPIEDYERTVLMFDGGDEAAVAAARERWRAVKAAGFDATYWRQTERGGWEKAA